MIQHPQLSDPVTAQGLAHLDQCAACQCVLAYEKYADKVLAKEPAMPRMLPDGTARIKYQPLPNINRVEPHAWCQGTVKHDETFSSRPGDVRVCKHGKVQMRSETPPGSNMQGPGTDWWRDLHPVFTPILWRRARAALTQWEQA